MDSAKSKQTAPGEARETPAVVNSLLHPLAVTIRQLLSRSDKQRLERFLIDDEENILQALRARVPIEALFYAGDAVISERLRQELSPGLPVHEVAKRTCKKIFENDRISRVFAIAKAPPARGLDTLAAIRQDLVILEDVGISGNIGAIIRTSVALGAGAIVLLNADPVDVWDRRLIRASRGHLFALPVVTATTDDLIRFCERHRLPIVVTAPHAGTPVHEISLRPHRLAIVFGGEKSGCSAALTAAATLPVRIPTDARVESLNVSAAAGITLYHRFGFNRRAGEEG